jgi:hypothetical protein
MFNLQTISPLNKTVTFLRVSLISFPHLYLLQMADTIKHCFQVIANFHSLGHLISRDLMRCAGSIRKSFWSSVDKELRLAVTLDGYLVLKPCVLEGDPIEDSARSEVLINNRECRCSRRSSQHTHFSLGVALRALAVELFTKSIRVVLSSILNGQVCDVHGLRNQ